MPQQAQHLRMPELKRVLDLLLDNENYRLSDGAHSFDQNQLLQELERDFELNVIAESLADNGYFAEEPLVVIPGPSDKFIVVEGNRRLATLKFILDPEIRQISRNPEYWKDVAGRLEYDISEVPVIIYPTRDKLTKFLGHRHIAGIIKWDPLSKARFINSLIEQKGKDVDFIEVARETGSRSNTIRNNYITYRVFLQARDNFNIDTSELEKTFSVFYRALTNPVFADFIGLDKVTAPKEMAKPIAKGKASALEELIGFIHGTQEIEPVITDSRQLTKLAEIFDNKEAYIHLRTFRNLEQAYQLSGGEERRLIDNLNKANVFLDDALRDAHRYKKSKKVAKLVERCMETMLEIIGKFPEIIKKMGIKY